MSQTARATRRIFDFIWALRETADILTGVTLTALVSENPTHVLRFEDGDFLVGVLKTTHAQSAKHHPLAFKFHVDILGFAVNLKRSDSVFALVEMRERTAYKYEELQTPRPHDSASPLFDNMLLAIPLFFLFSLAVSAKPIAVRDSPFTLPLVRRLNLTGQSTLVDIDRARIGFFMDGPTRTVRGHAARSVFDVAVTNEAVQYVTSVGVGTPPTAYTLIVDTGSSNTWVGAGKPYVKTTSSHDTGQQVSVTYGSGEFSGEEFTDTVTLGSLVITNQGIGVASQSEGFDGVDGILGLGPVDLTLGTLFPDTEATIPTVTDNGFTQGSLTDHEVSFSFQPTTEEVNVNGVVTFGGVDSSRFEGPLSFVPITSTSPSSEFVGIDQSITYGSAGTAILTNTAGIVDTGTTLLWLSSDALKRYKSAVGASNEADPDTGLFTISAASFAQLQSLLFHIGDTTFEFTANAQIWPRSLNTAIGGNANTIYLIATDIGTDTGSGLDFINGMVWLERFFLVYDVGAGEVGLATTTFTDATTN
ncbi:acid protease [Obba rivulosa]|uniref:Acid protease n=1 Tax=Obba rivulosa TaxID=1052685 RepID=A0A8E2AQ29_9APHY|nr:acid protease [Obba rivulosa]